jgi:TIR domain
MALEALQLFYSYANEDEVLRNQLDNHLKVLVRQRLIHPWYDREISGGQIREQEIREHLQVAHIILLLISPDFIASDYCYSSEMAEALLRHKESKARVIPIILRPCYWESIPHLKDLQPLPKNAKPVTIWPDRDIVFNEITRDLSAVVIELRNHLNIAQTSQNGLIQEKQQSIESRSTALAGNDSTHLGAMQAANSPGPFSFTPQFGILAGTTQHILTIPNWLHVPAVYWTRLLSTIVTTISLDIIAGGIGLNVWGPSSMFELVHRYPDLSIILGALFILVSILAWIIAGTPKPGSNPEDDGPTAVELSRRLVISSAISTTSSFLCFMLLALVILRPGWCSSMLCPPPAPVLNQNSNNDSTLEVYFTTLQGSLFEIPGDPAHYTLANLPTAIGALRIDQRHDPYRVAFGIHSLQRGSYGMFIEEVSLVVDDARPLPQPLKVWDKGTPLEYRSEPFSVTYNGEPNSSILNTIYVPKPGAHVQLQPGESDEISLEINSMITIDLHFHITVTYRVTNESDQRTVSLPGNFEVVFSDASNWQQYKLEGGRLIL